jgi:hypothetical protein
MDDTEATISIKIKDQLCHFEVNGNGNAKNIGEGMVRNMELMLNFIYMMEAKVSTKQ